MICMTLALLYLLAHACSHCCSVRVTEDDMESGDGVIFDASLRTEAPQPTSSKMLDSPSTPSFDSKGDVQTSDRSPHFKRHMPLTNMMERDRYNDADGLLQQASDSSVLSSGGQGGQLKLFGTRRRSLNMPTGCNNEADIGGSEWFASCNWPHMYSNGRRRLIGSCRCNAGYQQGPDGVRFSSTMYSTMIKPHEICMPCGCLNIASREGFSLDVCPVTYPNAFLSNLLYIRDTLVLPTLAEAQQLWQEIKKQVSSKFLELKVWISNAIDSAAASFKQFVNSFQTAALIQTGNADGGIWDNIEDVVVHAYTSIKRFVSNATTYLLDNTKSAWEAAKMRAVQLASAAKAAADTLSQRLAELIALAKRRATELIDGAKSLLSNISVFLKTEFNRFRDSMSGLLSFENFNLHLVLTNPTAFNGQLTNVKAQVDYLPDTSEAEGGLHGVTTPLEDLVTLSIDHNVTVDAWGSTPIDVKSAVRSFSIDAKKIQSHGLMGFLEDIATGNLKFGVTAKDLRMKLFGVSVGWMSNLAFDILNQITLEVPIPEEIENKADDAVDAYNFLTFQRVEQLGARTIAKISNELSRAGDVVKAKADDEGVALELDVEDKEDLAEEAAKETSELAKAFSSQLENAGREACKTTDGKPCVFPFVYGGATYNQCTAAGHGAPWCSTQVDSSGDHMTGNWGDCSDGCSVELINAETLLVNTGAAAVEAASLAKQLAVDAAIESLNALKAATESIRALFL